MLVLELHYVGLRNGVWRNLLSTAMLIVTEETERWLVQAMGSKEIGVKNAQIGILSSTCKPLVGYSEDFGEHL